MTEFLDRDTVVAYCSLAIGFPLVVGDEGLLQSAITRPQASAFGTDAYPTVWDKAGALLHSLAANHPFVDGNKRSAWTAAWAFLGLNGHPLPDSYDVDVAEQLVVDACTGVIDWTKIAEGLRQLGS
ncbi:type II toxin-antitoxin system death-on-curing family toxin [Mycobacterium sp.]|uniref:type II toxin-antitoxin system death-on-curing family toxin n=1 Tax=Mycobacterium sp. TaxID=1785 RepID=UPI003A8A6018